VCVLVCCAAGVVYPDCELCGLCYDSIATRIDRLASDVERSYLLVIHVSSSYYRQSNDVTVSLVSFDVLQFSVYKSLNELNC